MRGALRPSPTTPLLLLLLLLWMGSNRGAVAWILLPGPAAGVSFCSGGAAWKERPRRRLANTRTAAVHDNDESPPIDDNDDDASNIPPGRVKDIDAWLKLSSDSLQQLTGVSLLDHLSVDTLADVHACERYAVLSHGTQDDPIYCYFNAGALLTFEFPESTLYQMPSRYSAPEGRHRVARQEALHGAEESPNRPPDAQCFPTIVRQNVHGEQFELQSVWYWTVYNGTTVVGQTAFFDRNLMVAVKEVESEEGSPPGVHE